MGSYNKYYEEALKKYNADAEEQISVQNQLAEANKKLVEDEYNAGIAETKSSYNELFDTNEVQRIINERQIAENMVNMGLTDSGLNRTQMTANQLSYANNRSKISIEQQKAVDTLARTMRAQITSIENDRLKNESSIRSTARNNAAASATSMWNTEQEEYTKQLKASLDAQNEALKISSDNAKQKATARNTLISQLSDNSTNEYGNAKTSQEQKQALVDNYAYTYKGQLTDEDYLILKSLGFDISNKDKYGYKYWDPNEDRVDNFIKSLPFSLSKLSEGKMGPHLSFDSKFTNYKREISELIKNDIEKGALSKQDVAELIVYYGLQSYGIETE